MPYEECHAAIGRQDLNFPEPLEADWVDEELKEMSREALQRFYADRDIADGRVHRFDSIRQERTDLVDPPQAGKPNQ